MTLTLSLSVLCGLTFAVGVLLAGHALLPQTGAHRYRPPLSRWRQVRPVVRAVGVPVAGGLAAGWATGWPAAAVATAAGVVFLPRLIAPAAPRQAIDRAEALASWTRRVSDLLAAGAGGLDHALSRSAATAPAALAVPVGRLAAEIRSQGTETALRRFATTVADPAADQVVLAMLLRVRDGGSGLVDILQAQTTALQAEAHARREIEADRATPRTTLRCLVGITLALLTGLVVFARDYLSPFDTLAGQGVLAVIAVLVGVSMWWMHHLTTASPPVRLVGAAGDPA